MKIIKNFVFIILFTITFSFNIFAQVDSIYAIIQGDSVTIWHTQTFRNCASRFLINYELDSCIINIAEIDTIGAIANCMCYYDLSICIGSLPNGSYIAKIFGIDVMFKDTTYIGETVFEIYSSASQLNNKLSQTQSECYDLNSIAHKDKPILNYIELSPIYPNPFNSETNIEFSLLVFCFLEISIFDNNGRELDILLSEYLNKGNYSIKWNAKDYPSGIYYISLKMGDIKKVQKAVIIK